MFFRRPARFAGLSGVAARSSPSLHRKSNPILHIRYPKPWNLVAESSFAQDASADKNRGNVGWRCLLSLLLTAVLGNNDKK